MVVPFAQVQEDPASSKGTASLESDVALCFTNPGGRASPADFATAIVSALVVPLALVGPSFIRRLCKF